MEEFMKKSLFIATFTFCALSFTLLFADPGVVIDAKGSVNISQSGKTVPAQTGTQFSDGATIDVAKGGSATLMFSSGATKKLASGEKFTAMKMSAGENGKPLIKGLAMAYNDATAKSRGPVVHGMVKAVPGGNAKGGDQRLDQVALKQMRSDLSQINALGLDKNGKALMQAQVYYKYDQNQKMVNVLLPVYKSQKPPADMVKSLLSLGYERLGKPEEAARYK